MVEGLKITPKLLKEIQLLNSFSEQELAKLIPGGTISEVEAHTNIMVEGEPSWGFYIILEGLVGVFKTNQLTGLSFELRELQAGNFFGEMSIIDDNPRAASVKSLTPTKLFFISKEAFHSFLNQSADLKLRFYSSCVKSLVNRLRELNDNYVVSQYQLWQTAIKKEGKDR